MKKYTLQATAKLTLSGAAVLFVLAACGGGAGGNSTADADSLATRSLELAGVDSAVVPQLQDVPEPQAAPQQAAAPATPQRPAQQRPATPPTATPPKPTTPAVTPTPAPAPAPTSTTVAAGTTLQFASASKVCTNTHAVGDRFTATVQNAVEGSNGVSVPTGAVGTFEITSVRTAKNSGDSTSLAVRLVSLKVGDQSYPVDATVTTASTERVRSATKGDDAKKVAAGAAVGAIIGKITGKSTKGAVVGAAAGAAAGTAAAAATADFDTCLDAGAAIAINLDKALTIQLASN